MSILIRGMEMPKNCAECFLADETFCKYLWNNGRYICRHPDCPLTEISFNKEQMEIANKMLKERG